MSSTAGLTNYTGFFSSNTATSGRSEAGGGGVPQPIARPPSTKTLIAPPPGLGPAPSDTLSRTYSSPPSSPPPLESDTESKKPEDLHSTGSKPDGCKPPAWMNEPGESVATNERYSIRIPCSKDNHLIFKEDTYSRLEFDVDAKLHADFVRCYWDGCSWRGDGENCQIIKPKYPNVPAVASHFPNVVRRMGGPENPLIFTERTFILVDIDMGDVHAVFDRCNFLYCNFDGWTNCVERGCTKVSHKKGTTIPKGLRRTAYVFSVNAVNSTGDVQLKLWGTISHSVDPVEVWKDEVTIEREKSQRRLSRRLSSKLSQLIGR